MGAPRIFADTNLFLRYLTNDVPAQADAVEALLRRAEKGEIELVANAMVISEIVWALESFYHVSRPEIKDRVLAILSTPGLHVAEEDLIATAIATYAEKNVDYADAYNAAWLLYQGLTTVCTFHRRHFAQIEGLAVRVPGDG